MLRISFPFRFFEVGERNCTSFEKKMIADISSVLAEIRVQRKRKNKDIAVAQKVYCILLRIYSSGLANLNVANLYMSTSSTLRMVILPGTISNELPRHCGDWYRFEM